MVLSISDTLANFAGQIQKGNIWIRTFHDRKSIYGITVYSLSACLILYLFLPDFLV
jgi:dolichol kinase